MLAALTPQDTETLGLLALIEMQASRLPAGPDPTERPVLLAEQDRTRWDRLLIRAGAGQHRPHRAAGRHRRSLRPRGCDRGLSRPGVESSDGHRLGRITALYDGLARISPSPIVELNRGVATAQAFGPEAGLDIVLPLFDRPSMRDYYLLSAVAGDLLCRSGAHDQAREHFLRAAARTRNGVERTTMQGRAEQCATVHTPSA